MDNNPNFWFLLQFLRYVYFARPDSLLEGQMVYSVRMKCGKQLAIEAPIHLANKEMSSKVIVAPIPETSTPAALGFAEQVSVS